MDLKEMASFIEQNNSNNLFKLNRLKRNPLYLKDEELRFIDNLLDDRVINRLLSYDGYTPSMRDIFPCHFLRAEVLKAVKYPEISYRKFCSKDYMGRDQKENRTFIGLPVNRNKVIDHSQLSQFRSSLTFAQMMNLGVYILHHFFQYDFLGDSVVHCVDSSELAIDNQRLLASVEVKGQKIRIYDDIDCDCGKRRNKRDKSAYVVGYRMHTLTAINAKTGCSFPLFSVLAPANHHDSHFLGPLARLGKSMGIELRLISADEAYHDKDGDFFKETGINLVTPPGSKVSVPENVDLETMNVTFDEMCEIPMTYMGVENECHEFKCSASPGECFRSDNCPQFRTIGLDGGYFQRILYGSDEVRQALDIRKNGERPFNLLNLKVARNLD
jgi:hypothetical protein